MVDPQKFPYKIIDRSLGMVDSAEPTLRERMPYLPLILGLDDRSLNTEGWLSRQYGVIGGKM
jgi:hypothetical protein